MKEPQSQAPGHEAPRREAPGGEGREAPAHDVERSEGESRQAPRGPGPPQRSFLIEIGARIRAGRGLRGWSRRQLAVETGLSERFLAQVESGEGNPSVVSLAQIAGALGTTAGALLTVAGAGSRPGRQDAIALLGLRGAGKSTVGRALAARLGASFVELDARVEEAAGLSLREMFELHGEEYYRRFEREALETVLEEEGRVVIATGGGIVTHRESFERLRRGAVTVWLRASPEDHWSRVVAQGDHRPMANDPLAMSHLRALLAQREGLYRQADHIVETSGAAVDDLVERIALATGTAAGLATGAGDPDASTV